MNYRKNLIQCNSSYDKKKKKKNQAQAYLDDIQKKSVTLKY